MKLFYSLPFLIALFINPSLQAVTLSQIDTFDSTVLSWGGGSASPPTHVATGGPAGSGDGYLSVSQTNFHLGTNNTNQWTGDFLAAGITAIEMDLNVFSFTDNVGPNGPGPTSPLIYVFLQGLGGSWTSNTPVTLTGGWQHAVFGITASDLTYLSGGTGSLNDTLSNTTKMLIRHDYVSPSIPMVHPPHVTASIGIDNITAVPEPSAITFLGLAALAGFCRRRRR